MSRQGQQLLRTLLPLLPSWKVDCELEGGSSRCSDICVRPACSCVITVADSLGLLASSLDVLPITAPGYGHV